MSFYLLVGLFFHLPFIFLTLLVPISRLHPKGWDPGIPAGLPSLGYLFPVLLLDLLQSHALCSVRTQRIPYMHASYTGLHRELLTHMYYYPNKATSIPNLAPLTEFFPLIISCSSYLPSKSQ